MKNSKSLTTAYVATILVCTLLAIWIGSRYVGVSSRNFEGGFQRLTQEDCYSSTLPGCKLELPKNENYNLLLGDSEAISISDLFKKGMSSHSYVSALTACSFIPKSIIREDMSENCRKLNARNFQIVFGATCKNVYIFNRFRPETQQEQMQYFESLSKIAQSCWRLTLIGTPIELIPRFNAYSNLVLKTAINSPDVFNRSDFDGRSLHWNTKLSDFISKSKLPNLNYINTNRFLVTRYPTNLKNLDGEYLYADSTHLSKYGGQIIMEKIENLDSPS